MGIMFKNRPKSELGKPLKPEFLGSLPSRPNRQVIGIENHGSVTRRHDVSRKLGEFEQPTGYHPAHRKLVSNEPLESFGAVSALPPGFNQLVVPKVKKSKPKPKKHHRFRPKRLARRLKLLVGLLIIIAAIIYLA